MATEVIIDSYPETNGHVTVNVNDGANAQSGQSITGDGRALTRVRLFVNTAGTLSDNVYARIYDHSGTFGTSSLPTGSAIASSDAILAGDLASSEIAVDFLFSGSDAINLTNATNYFVAIDGTSAGVSGGNDLGIGVDTTSPTHGGNYAGLVSSSWVADAAGDAVFYVYGTSEPSITSDTPSVVTSTKATLNGTIGGAGTSSIDERGFVYDVASRSNPNNTAPGSSSYAFSETNSGSFSAESFSDSLTGLQSNKKYYVRAYAHNSSGYAYGEEVTFVTENFTKVTFNSVDPTDIFKELLDSFTSRGGVVDYDGSSTDDTGLSLSYTFNTNTVLEGVKVAYDLAPSTWYWYVDLGTEIAYFKNTSTTADHTIIKGRHINDLKLVMSTEQVENLVYFTGGLDGSSNLFSQYQDATSISDFGQRLERRTDNRVTIQSTADAYGNGTIASNKDEKYNTTVKIVDGTYDITLYKPGDVVGFSGFGTFIDGLLLQIARIDYSPNRVTLSLGELPYRTSDTIDKFKRDILAIETVDNPDTPS